MKKYIFAILSLVVAVVGVGFVFAQQNGDGGGRGAFGHARPGFALEKIADELNLSNEQRAQIKKILEGEKTTIQSLIKTARQTREQLKDLGTNGAYNEARVEELAARQAETTRQLIVEKEKTKAAIFAVLTPEQRTKAAELKNKFEEKMRGRFAKRFGGGDGGGGDFAPSF
jgi:periplasmic protein CpxP/Spy